VPSPGLPLIRATAPLFRALHRLGQIGIACLVIALAVCAVSVAGCTNAAVDKAAGEGAGAGIELSTSADAVTIENHTTRPLLNVRVTLTATGGTAPFIKVVPTIDANQNVDVRLSEFRTEDAVTYDPAANVPKQVRVTARDTLGNSYDESADW
jgi:hypothetical protein